MDIKQAVPAFLVVLTEHQGLWDYGTVVQWCESPSFDKQAESPSFAWGYGVVIQRVQN